MAKGVGMAKGVQRLGWLHGPQLGLKSFLPPALVVVPCGYFCSGRGCVERGLEARAASNPPSLEATYFRPQPFSPYLAGTVAKGVGVAKEIQRLGWLHGPQLGLNSFLPPALVTVPCGYFCGGRRGWAGFTAPSLDLTPFRPQPLSSYLAGTVAKGVSVAKLVQRLGWLCGTQVGLNTFSPPALVAVPCGYCGEGRGCGERGTEAGLAPRPASFEATHFRPKPLSPYLAGCGSGERGPEAWLPSPPPTLDLTHYRPQPLSPYLAGTVVKGVGMAKGVQKLGWLHGPQLGLNSFSPPALVAVPCGYFGEGGLEARAASNPPSLEATHFHAQPLSPYLSGTVAKGVGVAKGVQRLGWLCGRQLGLNSFLPPALVTEPCGCGERGPEAALPPRLSRPRKFAFSRTLVY
uniref:Uncharacterized protein n=1 Tax=Oryza barthii TaxID=65489 RepID=A0A0D3ENQ9_9ORYZ